MAVTIRQPGLLNSELEEIARLTPSAGTFSFKYNAVSEATLTVPEDGPAVGMHSWVALYGLRGFLGVYRVVNAAQTVGRQIQLSLLHGIDILSDSVWEPASAGASEETFSGNMTQYLTAILNHQTHLIQIGESDPVKPWVLGTCASSEVITDKKIGYNRLIDLLMDTVPEGGDYELVYDMTVFPWTVSMVAKSSAVAGEFRAAHNMSGVTITYNDADLCTRLALAVTSGGSSRVKIYNAGAIAQNTWGIVTKTASIDTNDTLSNPTWPEADAWAAGFFALHAQPSVQVQVEGEDLARQTGDTWDEAALGRMMRVPLPDYGFTVLARAVAIDQPDPYGQPERVTVSLANTLPQFTEQIRIVEKTANSAYGRAGAAAAKAEEADEKADEVIYRTDFTKTDRGLGMLAQAIGVKIDPQTHLPVYDEVTGQYAFEGNNGATLSGFLSVEADKVISEVVTARSDFPELSSRLTQMSGDIDARVKSVDLDTKVAAEGFIKLNAATGAAQAVVGASLLDNGTLSVAKIVTAVNGSTGQSVITLDADHIEMTSSKKLGGMVYVSGGDLFATGDILTTNGGTIYAAGGFETDSNSKFEGNLTIDSGDLDLINGATLKEGGSTLGMVIDTQIVADGATGYKLQKKMYGSSSWTDAGSFSRATTLTGAWSGGVLTVTASPQGETYVDYLSAGTTTWSGNTATVPILQSTTPSNPQSFQPTGQSVTVNATSIYNNGWDAAEAKLVWPSAGSSTSAIIKYPDRGASASSSSGTTADQSAKMVLLSDDSANSKVVCRIGGTAVAECGYTGGASVSSVGLYLDASANQPVTTPFPVSTNYTVYPIAIMSDNTLEVGNTILLQASGASHAVSATLLNSLPSGASVYNSLGTLSAGSTKYVEVSCGTDEKYYSISASGGGGSHSVSISGVTVDTSDPGSSYSQIWQNQIGPGKWCSFSVSCGDSTKYYKFFVRYS